MTLPATSVCRTSTRYCTALSPARLAIVSDEPVPDRHTSADATALAPSKGTQADPFHFEVVNSQDAPASIPATLICPWLVILSVALLPLSMANAIVGAATVVSKVNCNCVAGVEILPAASVWRTRTVLAPLMAAKLLRGFHVVPPLTLTSTTAPLSAVTLSAPLLVIRSVPDLPVSLRRDTPGETGAAVSSVKVSCPESEILPAASVWRT